MSFEVIPRVSEEQWLAERMKRVTATNIGKLANGGPAVRLALKREKQGERTFFGNAYTEWGHEREPSLLARLGFLFGLEPNDALYVDGDWAATPDGVHPSLPVLAEVKTTGIDWWQGDDVSTLEHLRRVMPEYVDQVLWAQLVCDASETVFAWEVREGEPGAFTPGVARHIRIPRDDARIAELVEIATDFLVFLAEDDVEVSEWDGFMARYKIAKSELAEKQSVVADLEREFREKQGDRELAVETPFGKISYSRNKPRKAFDRAGFVEAHPELKSEIEKKFMKLGEVKTEFSLRITPVK